MSKIAAILFEDEINRRNLQGVMLVNMVHDEIIVECPKELTEEVKEILKGTMIKSGKLFCKEIPIKADIHSGNNWGIKG